MLVPITFNESFKNGGMLFSSLLLPLFAIFSLYCFMLLVNTRKLIVGSYGDIGGILFGSSMRVIILASIVISQIGFVCAYTIFTAENLRAFVTAVSNGKHSIDVKLLILIQLVILLPCGKYPFNPANMSVIPRHLKTVRYSSRCRCVHHDGPLCIILLRHIYACRPGNRRYHIVQPE